MKILAKIVLIISLLFTGIINAQAQTVNSTVKLNETCTQISPNNFSCEVSDSAFSVVSDTKGMGAYCSELTNGKFLCPNGFDQNVSIGDAASDKGEKIGTNDKLKNLEDKGAFYNVREGRTGQEGLFYAILQIAESVKNIVILLTSIYFLIITIRMIGASNSEEEVQNFKKGIVWITMGIMIMQISLFAANTIYNKDVNPEYAYSIFENLMLPFINLLSLLASVLFIGIAIYTFFRLVTANGKEDVITSAKNTLVYSIVGFIVIMSARTIVNGMFGDINCSNDELVKGQCMVTPDQGSVADFMLDLLSWINGFIAVITTLAIIYVGFQLFVSRGEEDKVSKGKKAIIYILAGIVLMAINYMIIVFLVAPDSSLQNDDIEGVERTEFINN